VFYHGAHRGAKSALNVKKDKTYGLAEISDVHISMKLTNRE